MKKLKYIALVAASAILGLTSCKKFLDINENPNDPTSSEVGFVIPQALTGTAALTVTYNTYGAWQVGYTSNAGGFGGFGSQLTYNYDATSYTGVWSASYNNLEDYQYILNETDGKDEWSYFNAAARIMKALVFQMLVDQYNDVPYTEALQGLGNTTPAYDNAEDIYRDLYDQLDMAIATIHDAQFPRPLANSIGTADVMFNGDMTRWIRLANTLKLKLLVRASGTDVFNGVTPTFDPAGFIQDDVIINPGYSNAAGKQNPAWQTYHSSFAPTAGNSRSIITTHYVVGFYNANKLTDPDRAAAVYRGGVNPARNQTGEQVNNPPAPANGPVWFSGNGSTYAFADNPDGSSPDKSAIGVLKGRNMGQPLMLLSEALFLQAEARMRGIISTGDVTEFFTDGVIASFRYLYKNSLNVIAPNPLGLTDYEADALAYMSVNANNPSNPKPYLTDITEATTDAQRLEAIITQKYIALNMIHGHEAWAEYRRTGYPAINNTTPLGQYATFVSILSEATTVDRLPGRILYPSTEFQLNAENVPGGVTVFGSYVFWDRRN